jgi:hypothetical protein
MMTFDIVPFVGPLPIRFGMSRSEVTALLGPPIISNKQLERWGANSSVNVGYDKYDNVYEIVMTPDGYQLRLDGALVWDENKTVDPNPLLLSLDSAPLERVGFLVFTKLGIATTGFHDDDPGQFAITLYPAHSWDDLLKKGRAADLSRYVRHA